MSTRESWTCPPDTGACTNDHTLDVALRRNTQQLACIVAQDRRPLGVTQAWCAENVLHGGTRPWVGIICTDHDLTSAALRHQMPQSLGGEYDRVEIEIPHILTG